MARSPANLFTAAALLGLPASTFALGLGDIQLTSALNQPLDAQIEILGATPQDLRDLNAAVAGRDTFNRYGLDYPQFLVSLHFSVEKGADGSDVLRVTSSQPVTEPFLTFLIEADWARGRLLREYTVLLDPPVFMPEETAPVAVEAPRGAAAQPAPAAGAIERPVEPTASSPDAQSVEAQELAGAAPAPSFTGNEYQVNRGDTLWLIASRTRPDSSTSLNQMMVALYRSNPDAFLGNMNLVKEGSILRVPAASDIGALASSDANAEVERQTAEWRGRPATQVSAEAQLKLVPPKAGADAPAAEATPGVAGATSTTTGAASGEAVARAEQRSAALSAEVSSLKGQLEDARRLLAVKDGELAKLQQTLEATESPAATPEDGAPAETGVDLEPAESATGESATAEDAAPPEPVIDAGPESETSSEPVVPVAKPAPKAPAVVRSEPETSWLDSILGVFKQTWVWIAAALAFLALGAVALKRRRPAMAPLEELDDAAAPPRIEPEVKREPVPAAAAAKARPAAAVPVAPVARGAPTSDTGNFEITGTFRPIDFDGAEQTTAESEYLFSDSGSALAIDQADPISEADFHMAYGLYDQASELVRKALEREPSRQDLQLKLLEILFVWGNKDVFRRDAQAFRADLTRGGQWDKIVIMGRQICPDDALFDGGSGAPSDAGVDLDLASSANMAAPVMPRGVDESPSLDFDLDDALTAKADLHSAETVPATGEYLELQENKSEDVEVHDAALTEVARRLEARMRPRAGDVGVALDLGETIAPEDVSATRTLAENKPKKSDEEAFGDFFAFTGVAEAPEPDPTGTREVVLDFEGDMLPDSTTAEFKIELPDDGSGVDLDIGQTGVHSTKLSATLGGDTTTMLTPGGDTTIVSSFGDTETVQSPGFVDPTARTVQAPRPIGFGRGGDDTVQAEMLDFDVGVGGSAADTDRGSTVRVSPSELALPDAQDGVLDEVGTKLDLARAYIDMGDPDGARSILAEVIEEGDDSQRQNAHTLLRSIA